MPVASPGVNVVSTTKRRVVGVDVFVETELLPAQLARELTDVATAAGVRLQMITNRGAMVFPSNERSVSLVDHFRCRFIRHDDGDLADDAIIALLQKVGARYRWMHVEKLQEFDGEAAFSKSQVK
jgi:isocitrate dehydrogenase